MHQYNVSPLWAAIYDALYDLVPGGQDELEKLTWRVFHAIKGKRR